MTNNAPGGGGADPLPTYNPWPGDPAEYDAVAARLADRETQSNDVRSGILGMLGDPNLGAWLGQSADAFKKTLEPLPNLLGTMVYAYGTAAQAVRTYAQQVRAGQADFAKEQNAIHAHAQAHPESVDGGGLGRYGGIGSDRWRLESANAAASSQHDEAMKTCAQAVAAAEQDLRRVKSALAGPEFRDFNATFTGNGGTLSDLVGMEYMGNDVLPSQVDPQKILDTIGFMHQALGDSRNAMFPGLAGAVILQRLSTMTPAEVDALLAMMTPEDRAALNQAIGEGDKDSKIAWSNLLLTDVSAETLTVVQSDLGNIEPSWKTDHEKDLHWGDASDIPLFGPNGVDIEQDLQQGNDGDCWFLSSAAAIAERSPDFIPARMHQNPNGTYTVTFYKDGKPVDITVDGRLPTRADGSIAYAKTTPNSQWVAIYEKAYAQYQGGYGAIDGGGGGRGLHDLTGQPTDSPDPGDHSLQDVAQWIQDGRAVTTGSHKDQGFLWWGGDGEYVDGGKIVTAHEYSVESVDLNAHPPTITLLNPWGVDSTNDHGQTIGKITLTEDEWHKYFDEMGVTKVKP